MVEYVVLYNYGFYLKYINLIKMQIAIYLWVGVSI